MEYGDWTDWLLCLGIAVLLGAGLPVRNPEGHSPRYWRKHSKTTVTTPPGALTEKPPLKERTLWSYVVGWPVVVLVGPGLVLLGFGVLSMAPPEVKVAQWCLALGYLVILGKISYWVAWERTDPLTTKTAFIFVVFAATGVLWLLSSTFAAGKTVSETAKTSHTQEQPQIVTPVDVPKLKRLYVELSTITQERQVVYGDLFANEVKYATKANDNEQPTWTAHGHDLLAEEIAKITSDLDTDNKKIAEVEQRLAVLLADIQTSVPDTPELSSLVVAAHNRPFYKPTPLTAREWEGKEWSKWLRIQEPIATKAIAEQSTYPLNALAEYLNNVINKYEKRD